MAGDLFNDSREFTPRLAFLYAFDDAIKATVQSLNEVGLDEEAIWTAFSEAMTIFHTSALAVDRESLRDDFGAGHAVRQAQESAA